MTMEFLTLNDARAQTPHSIVRMIVQTVMTASELLRHLSWTCTDKDLFEYEQEPAKTENWAKPGDVIAFANAAPQSMIVTVPMFSIVSKACGKISDSPPLSVWITDLAHDLEKGALGHKAALLNGLTNLLATPRREMVSRPVAGSDMDVLVSRLGRHWNPAECVFLLHSGLFDHLLHLGVINVHTTLRPTHRGAPAIRVDAWGFEGKIACVSLDPAHGLFGIGKGQFSNYPYQDANNGTRADFGPVLGWQIEAGIREKADPSRPEEIQAADKDGMFEIVRVSWTGGFGLRNQNAGASIEGLICS